MAMLRIAGHVGTKHRKLLRDIPFLKVWLPELVKAIDMKCVGEVVVQDYGHWEGGDAPSAVQFIEESAVVVHCYPEDDFIQIVLDSCKPIEDWQKVANKIMAKLNLTPTFLDYEPGWGWPGGRNDD